MALPKFIIRTLRPYIILLSLGMIYLAYQQLNSSELNAHRQSLANLNTSSHLVSSQVEAAISKLYLLHDAQSVTEFDHTAQRILKHSPSYADVISVNHETKQYRSANLESVTAEQEADIQWTPLQRLSSDIAVSSLYEKKPNYWVFAVKYTPNKLKEIWLEFDLMHTTQSLRGLRTLSEGYVFVIDQHTGRLIFHPDPVRIGTQSISFHSGINELIEKNIKFGEHEYYYRDQFKVTVFDANNPYGWVFISGTDRADILATSYQFSLTAVVIASLLLLAIAINYFSYQLNQSLAELNTKHEMADFKSHLRQIFDRFLPHQGVQFCLYDADYGHFSTIDFHGNSKIILTDPRLAQSFSVNNFSYFGKKYADPLAKLLRIESRHYSIPLFSKGELIAVIYVQSFLPTYHSVLRMIRDFSEVALSNLLLHKQLRSKDVMTHLDNKMTVREEIERNIEDESVYFALCDLDHFKKINDQYGHLCGDKVILATAELMEKCFPKPGAISLARYGGEEFCVLFHANDQNDAYEQCELFRQLMEKTAIEFSGQQVRATISIGITQADATQHITIGRADKALYQAKGLGRNQVVLNTFKS